MTEEKFSDEELCSAAKDTVLQFIDMLGTVLTKEDEKGDLFMVKFFFEKLHPKFVMNKLVKEMLPWEQRINDRDSKFFVNNKTIFSSVPEERRNYFSDIWNTDSRMTKKVKNIVWQYLDTLVELSKAYKKNE